MNIPNPKISEDGFISRIDLIDLMEHSESFFNNLFDENTPDILKKQIEPNDKALIAHYFVGQTKYRFSYRALKSNRGMTANINRFLAKDLVFYYKLSMPGIKQTIDSSNNMDLDVIYNISKATMDFIDFTKKINMFENINCDSAETYYIFTPDMKIRELIDIYEMYFSLSE